MKRENVNKFIKNILLFTAPALFVFFYQLHQGVDFKTAGLIALLALYGVLADFFKKMSETE